MDQSRCSVIKHFEMFPKYENDNLKQYEKCLLPKTPGKQMNMMAAGPGVGRRMVFNPSSLLLPPVLSFGGHMSYPPTLNPNINKDLDYFKLFPPLNFNPAVSPSLIIQPPPSSPKQPTIGNETKANNLKRQEENGCNLLVIPQKKAKFDFSIEALTAKPDITSKNNKKPLQEINQNVTHTDSAAQRSFYRDMSNSSSKSRGRPSADLIEVLKQRSIQNPHRYSCSICHRSFPRKKSLDTHHLTHSDVKPYACDFPGCNRKFKQSGQLKTHLRLHTGEKPFKCTYPFCDTAFTHANRKCAIHPEFPLRRSSTDALPQNHIKYVCNEKLNNDSENIEKVKSWFEKHLADRESKLLENKENIPPNSFVKIKEEEEEYVDVDIETEEPPTMINQNEENNKRLLSAVALVELRDQMKEPSNKKDNYNKLFSTNHIF